VTAARGWHSSPAHPPASVGLLPDGSAATGTASWSWVVAVIGSNSSLPRSQTSRFSPWVADLGTDAGVEAVADVCAREELTMLVNNAGVAHYMPFIELPANKANELLHVKVVAPTMLARAAARGMVARGEGTIINVSGMLAFSGPAPIEKLPLRRAVYAGTLAHIVALSQALHEELKSQGVRIQALCPGVVATEFHERQGLDLGAMPRMSADDVVTASLRGLALGEVLCAPGVERSDLLDAVFRADLAAFAAQAPQLAERYRTA
jgi:hypothetical protein